MSRGTPVISNETLVAGLRADFAKNYEPMYKGLKEGLSDVMEQDVPSNKLTELFAYFESPVHPARWDRGEAIRSKAFKSVGFSITNKDWGVRVDWHRNDREDDQLRGLYQRAQEAGQNFALLRERVMFQMLTGATDNDLLEAVPNAPDGVPLYSTVDGDGAARYGATNGNLLTGSGVADPNDIRDDFWAATEQWRLFKDTEGQPLFMDGVLDRGIVIYYAAENDRQFREAFIQSRPFQIDGSAGSANAAAAPSNVILESGMPVFLRPTQRLTGADWYAFLRGCPHKPIIHTMRRALTSAYAEYSNSDQARTNKTEYVQWDSREGYGVNVAFGTIKINN